MKEKSALTIAREAAGMSLAKLSAKTNIRLVVLEDLENNLVNASGGIAYARGHIRSIAKVLKTDVDLLISEIESAQDKDKKLIFEKLVENNIVIIPRENRKLKFKTLASLSTATLALVLVAQIAINNAANVNNSINLTLKPESQISAPEPVSIAPKGVTLVLSGITGTSWIGLTNSLGEQIFNGKISEGQTQTFTDSSLIKAVIGNAGAVHLRVNGSDIGLAGGSGEVVRLNFDPNGATQS
jgi:cytoskeletal protein RodZ